MSFLYDLNPGLYAVVDINDGSVLHTDGLQLVPWPQDSDIADKLLSDADTAFTYAQEVGIPVMARVPGAKVSEDAVTAALGIVREAGYVVCAFSPAEIHGVDENGEVADSDVSEEDLEDRMTEAGWDSIYSQRDVEEEIEEGE